MMYTVVIQTSSKEHIYRGVTADDVEIFLHDYLNSAKSNSVQFHVRVDL